MPPGPGIAMKNWKWNHHSLAWPGALHPETGSGTFGTVDPTGIVDYTRKEISDFSSSLLIEIEIERWGRVYSSHA